MTMGKKTEKEEKYMKELQDRPKIRNYHPIHD